MGKKEFKIYTRSVEGITQIIFFGYQSDAELCTKVYEGALLYLEYRLKRLYRTAITPDYKKKS